jgi:Tfp pilus assembly protein PilO
MAFYNPILKQYQEMDLKPQTKNYFNLLATLFLLIVLIALIYPALKHITLLNRELSDARVEKAALVKKIDDLSLAQTNLAAVEKDLKLLNQALPVGSDVPGYVKRLEDLSSKNGLVISSVDIEDIPMVKPAENAALNLARLPYSINLAGNFSQFKQFLADLETSLRSSYVDSITLVRDSSGVKETIGAKAFYLDVDKSVNTK